MKAVLLASALLAGGVPVWDAIRPAPPAGPAPAAVRVTGTVTTLLRPGVAAPLRLTVANRSPRAVRIIGLQVRGRVDSRHRRAGCRRRDYAIQPVSRRHLPLRIRSHHAVQLRAGVRMRNLPTRNQDGCKGAVLHLRYRARVRR